MFFTVKLSRWNGIQLFHISPPYPYSFEASLITGGIYGVNYCCGGVDVDAALIKLQINGAKLTAIGCATDVFLAECQATFLGLTAIPLYFHWIPIGCYASAVRNSFIPYAFGRHYTCEIHNGRVTVTEKAARRTKKLIHRVVGKPFDAQAWNKKYAGVRLPHSRPATPQRASVAAGSGSAQMASLNMAAVKMARSQSVDGAAKPPMTGEMTSASDLNLKIANKKLERRFSECTTLPGTPRTISRKNTYNEYASTTVPSDDSYGSDLSSLYGKSEEVAVSDQEHTQQQESVVAGADQHQIRDKLKEWVEIVLTRTQEKEERIYIHFDGPKYLRERLDARVALAPSNSWAHTLQRYLCP